MRVGSMRVDSTTYLEAPPARVEAHLRSTRLLLYVAAPLVKFTACTPPELPENWEEGIYRVSLRLFGVIPFGKQAVVISFPENAQGFSLRDNGHSRLIRKWDHLITMAPSGRGTLYRDQVVVEAGLLTPVVWLFAQAFFRHRQGRWRKLVASGFDYSDTR